MSVGPVGLVTLSVGPGVVAVLPLGIGVGVSVDVEGLTVGSRVARVVGNGPGAVVGTRPGPKVGGVVATWLWVTDPPRVGEVDAGIGVGVVLTPGGPAGEGG